ncbi:hypothetical protein PEBR_09700 [Penicillium brasilianum]|uniref:beta-glucosidase n=1 Tax=Penicillium brasilianum TaxID=104259 RepID=A0A1S9S3Q6_PENBI|nr:hypothetical protein PEBR_09700 [Penicillium brasilianum]
MTPPYRRGFLAHSSHFQIKNPRFDSRTGQMTFVAPVSSGPSGMSAMWNSYRGNIDRDLLVEIGHLLAAEAKAKDAYVIFDHYLSDVLASHYCKALNEKGIVATLKHFVCNDQEHEPMNTSSIVTDGALREIYLLPFMIAITLGNLETIMTAYNKVNGLHASESSQLLQDILRGEWGWERLGMSD